MATPPQPLGSCASPASRLRRRHGDLKSEMLLSFVFVSLSELRHSTNPSVFVGEDSLKTNAGK